MQAFLRYALISLLLMGQVLAHNSVKVALFPLPPLNFLDEDGKPAGVYPDLVREIFPESDYEVHFEACTWAEGLTMLQDGRIDLMTTVGYSKSRADSMDFNTEGVANIWGQIFARVNSGIEELKDLDQRRVGIMNKDINGSNFIETAQTMGVHVHIVEYNTHADVFKAIQAGEVDAGVAPQHYGLRNQADFNLVGTSILFSPFSVYFATKKGHNTDLLNRIDTALIAWKQEEGSRYYKILHKWMGGGIKFNSIIPVWLRWGLGLVSLLSGILIAINRYLNIQIRHRTEEIKSKEKQYRDLVESANNVIIRLSPEGKITFINSFGIQLFGYAPDEILDRQLTEHLLPQVRYPGKDLVSSVNIMLNGGERYRLLENKVHCKDGRILQMQWSNRIISNSDGHPAEILAIGTDITEKKQAEQELIQTHSLINAMLDGIPDALIAVDLDSKIASVNKAFTGIFQWTESEVLQRTPDILLSRNHSEKLEHYFRSDLRTTESQGVYIRKDGSAFPAETITQPIHDDQHRVFGFITIIRDLSEKQKLEKQLQRSQKLESLGTMVSGIAHDFNNILQAILLNAENLEHLHQGDTDTALGVSAILNDVERARTLVKQILTFSRSSAGQEMKPVLLQNIVHEVLNFERSNFPSSIIISKEVDETCPPVLCDEVQMHQVLVNICNNAMQAMGDGKGELTVKMNHILQQDLPWKVDDMADFQEGAVRILIRDTGCGMSQEVMEKMFDPFFSTKPVGMGTGLGLSVVHGILESIRAKVKVHSELGKGSTFDLLLPVTNQVIEPEIQTVDVEAKAIRYGRILVVDDERGIRTTMERMLKRAGLEVDVAENGHEAWRTFQTQPSVYDCVLTDLTMPEMTGIELTRSIRTIAPDIPIILSSGNLSMREMKDLKLQGVSDFIQKPWRLEQLMEKLEQFERDP